MSFSPMLAPPPSAALVNDVGILDHKTFVQDKVPEEGLEVHRSPPGLMRAATAWVRRLWKGEQNQEGLKQEANANTMQESERSPQSLVDRLVTWESYDSPLEAERLTGPHKQPTRGLRDNHNRVREAADSRKPSAPVKFSGMSSDVVPANEAFRPKSYDWGTQQPCLGLADTHAPFERLATHGAFCMPYVVMPAYFNPSYQTRMHFTMPRTDVAADRSATARGRNLEGVPVASATKEQSARPRDRPRLTSREEPRRTTLMLRNLPYNYTRDLLLDLLDSEGFAGRYDFLYLPIDFRTHAAMGYAFVNLVSPEDAEHLRARFDGFSDWTVTGGKACSVSWSKPHQGLKDHIARYRNSPLMHESVPDAYRPILLFDGTRVDFPPPTRKVKPPRHGAERLLV